MLLDKSLELSSAQAVTSTAMSTNVIDLGSARNIGNTELYLFIKVGAAVTAAGAATVNFQLQTDDNSAMSSAATLFDSGAIGKASLTANTVLRYRLPVSANYERYLGLNYTVSTGPLTAGDFSAWISDSVQENTTYASGFAVQ